MVEYLDALLPKEKADAEFQRLWNELDWEQREDAPRREYWMNNYGLPYTYGRGAGVRTYECKPWDDFAHGWMLALNSMYSWKLDCCFMNGYKDERDQLGWHADDSPEMNPEQPVVVISLGAERDIMFRDKESRATSRQLLGHGSALIMPAGFQQTHEHRIPKAGRQLGPRISLTYRGMIV